MVCIASWGRESMGELRRMLGARAVRGDAERIAQGAGRVVRACLVKVASGEQALDCAEPVAMEIPLRDLHVGESQKLVGVAV
jgi:hypothetical protein